MSLKGRIQVFQANNSLQFGLGFFTQHFLTWRLTKTGLDPTLHSTLHSPYPTLHSTYPLHTLYLPYPALYLPYPIHSTLPYTLPTLSYHILYTLPTLPYTLPCTLFHTIGSTGLR